MKKKLYLHIGHGKTGSSAIQSFLAINKDLLYEKGVFYPIDDKDYQSAILDDVTSGNRRKFLSDVKSLVRYDKSVIYSSEFIFFWLLNNYNYDDLLRFIEHNKFDEVNILVYIRDPFDHILSSFQQKIKGEAFKGGLEDFCKSYQIPNMFMNLHSKLISDSKLKNILNIQTINYSESKSVYQEVKDWFEVSGLRIDRAVFPKKKLINRSLTSSELYLIYKFNQLDSSFSVKLYNCFVNNIVPDDPPVKLLLPPRCKQIIVNNNADGISYVEHILKEFGSKYFVETELLNDATEFNDLGKAPLKFNHQHIDCLIKILSDYEGKHGSSNSILNNSFSVISPAERKSLFVSIFKKKILQYLRKLKL